MYCIEGTTPEERTHMKRRDMALEMIRMKRNIPVKMVGDDTVYSSATEAAEYLGIRPQIISRQLHRTREGKSGKFVEAPDWEPYVDLMMCGDVNEYILHYVRIYYPDLYESSLHVVDPQKVEEHKKFCEIMDTEPIIDIEDGHYIDLLTDEVLMEVGREA